MMSTLLMSVRLGTLALLHHLREPVEEEPMSCGPGLARGALEAERRAVGALETCRLPSKSDTCVDFRFAGSVPGSTAKPWFWLVTTTVPVPRLSPGGLAPWWPNFIFRVFAPEASP